MSDAFLLIVADKIDDTQRSLMHVAVKDNAKSWWHRFEDLWVIRTEMGTADWRDLLRPFLLEGTSVLVIAMEQSPGGRWAAAGLPAGAMEWFNEEIAGRPKKLVAKKKPT